MNAGLGTLTALKTHLLNEQVRSKTTWDAAITALGLGIAARLEKYCDRKFARVVGDTYETGADRLVIVLPRYPIEAVSKVEVRSAIAQGWQDQGDPDQLLFNRRDSAGMIDIGGWLGGRYQRLRFTFTGGYWWTTNEDGSGTMPTGATARPDDLYLAWLLQCEAAWQLRDKLGVSIGEKQESRKQLNLSSLELVPEVEGILRSYRRFCLT